MHCPRNSLALDRRRLLTGAVASLPAISLGSADAQDATPTPVPVRIQTPDLAFVAALQTQLDTFRSTQGPNDLLLSIVPAEPAPDSLLDDLRLNQRRFSGAIVPAWSIPDLVRDEFVAPANPPLAELPPTIAQLRSFGGEWISTDFDHDCTLLYIRRDLLEPASAEPPETWDDLLGILDSTNLRIALPCQHGEQVVDHFAAMAGCYVGDEPFWFHPDTMQPTIASDAHQRALSDWSALAGYSVESSSTGDLWQSFIDGRAAFLVASVDALPYLLDTPLEADAIGITPLPGVRLDDGQARRVGNTTGPNWGGITIAGMDGDGSVAAFLDWLSTSEVQIALWSDRSSGVNPAVVDASRALQAAEAAGWPSTPTALWLEAVEATQNNPLQLASLRIAETRRYLQALELRIVAYLRGDVASPAEALELAASDWDAINQAIDVEIQRDLFARSMMPPPAQ